MKTIWNEGSKIDNWNQVDPSFPDVPLELFGPGTDSGTFDYFTDAINGEVSVSRTDYLATEDDNVAVQGVAGAKGGMAYFGLSYFEQNSDKLKVVAIDGGSGPVAPSRETVQSGEYTPLSRPLFIYPAVSGLAAAGDGGIHAVLPGQHRQESPSRPCSCRSTAEQTNATQAVLDANVGGRVGKTWRKSSQDNKARLQAPRGAGGGPTQ